ncbi:sigma-70 family RNA polymerase sigma factor [Paraliomyxa miuraensis]|uniref:sigma-70 family RNA polymerase sigma factor n=1 Tax=Paraliomyxa miuraensis TaxID=376150 RepID=UPI00225647BF|nr:sigma-70 family RNA polymerase sigma factor [Paraliomyxa miuraensis]MCX4242489.1 sigma-70 family RNA polymerase sigma factor [Paraliomyxa miuraensis]
MSKIARWLHLGREKVAILVEGASVGGLRSLLSSLLHEASPPVVCFHAPELLDVPSGSLVVLTVHEAELNWLNLNRPIIANKRLRILLWLEFPLHRLRGGAPDFFDWISHVVRCPSRPPEFAVRGLLAAKAAGRPVAWRGRALEAVMDRAGLEGARVEAGEEFSALVARLEPQGSAVPVWVAAQDPWHALRVDVATRHTGCSWWIVDHPAFQDDRYAVVHDDASSWEAATWRIAALLPEADRSWAACASALVEAEPGMVELVERSLVEGRSIAELCHALAHAKDPLDVLSERSTSDEGGSNLGAERRLPPGCRELMKRHAHALETGRATAWIRASDAALAAGHPDLAESFAVRAFTRASRERARLRARIAWAAACHARGRYSEAHERFHEAMERLGRASPGDPLLALLLTEQAAALDRERRHAEARVEAAQAITTWHSSARASMRAFLEALRLHGRSLAALGDHQGLVASLAEHEEHWPSGDSGRIHLMLERARCGDRAAKEQLAQVLARSPPRAALVAVAIDLALLHPDDSPRATVGGCIRALRLLQRRYGTTLHPQAIDARCVAGRALAADHPQWAEALLRRALTDSEILYHGAPHPQTADVALELAEVERRRGDLAASQALVERAERARGGVGVFHAARGEPSTTPSAAAMHRVLAAVGGASHRESDEILLDRARSGDFHARELLAARYLPLLRRFFATTVDPDRVDDLVQQTFLRFFSALDRFEGRSSLRTYLFMLARYALQDHFRMRSRYRRGQLPPEDPNDRREGSLPTPEEALAEAFERRALAAALRQLSHEYQMLLFLRDFEDLSFPEIARVLDIPESAARSRMRRAMAFLRESLMRALSDPEIELPDELDDPMAEWSSQMRGSIGQAMG